MYLFGYGCECYVYVFVVLIIFFFVGGLFVIYEGVEKFMNFYEFDKIWWWLLLVVLVIVIGLELFFLCIVVCESNFVCEKD